MTTNLQFETTVYCGSLVQMWDDCPRCFWRRYVLGEKRPGDFSEVYDIADAAMRTCLASAPGDGWIDVGVGPPRMRLHSQAVWVESTQIPFPDLGITFRLAGRYDAIVEDEDGCLYLLDCKTSARPEHELYRYRRQLDAYRFCLEHPDATVSTATPLAIDEIGLLVYTPEKFAFKKKNSGLYGETRWIEFSRDDSATMKFLRDVAILLAHDEPVITATCAWCSYRSIGEQRIA